MGFESSVHSWTNLLLEGVRSWLASRDETKPDAIRKRQTMSDLFGSSLLGTSSPELGQSSNLVRRFAWVALWCLFLSGALSAVAVASGVHLNVIGRFEAGSFDEGASEIVAYDPDSEQLFVVNSQLAVIDVVDISDPTTPTLTTSIDVTPYGGGANSVAVHDGVVAVAVQASVKQDPGMAVFFSTDGTFLSSVTAGALPDMITFSPNGDWVLVANEGEPNDDYSVDPEGSVTVIDVSSGAASLTQSDVRTADFNYYDSGYLDPRVRVFGPNATASQDFEPEYIAVGPHSTFAWVTLQENNAIAIVHIPSAQVAAVFGLGTKKHWKPGNGIDASNKDGGINIANWPVRGMFMPDSIATYSRWGIPFLVTANEGDSRDYDGYSEEERIGDLVLDPTAFPNAATLQLDENLGRLKTTTANGDIDGDGDYDRLYSYGARSFSIWTVFGHRIYDSGDEFEQITALALPGEFNSTNDENGSFDDRSDDKGPEPEGVAIGKVGSRTYAFLGLERVGGVAVYDITNPFHPSYVEYVNNRDFSGDPVAGTAGDLGPEGIVFIAASESPTGDPLLVVGNEVSGSTTIYSVTP